MSNRDLVIQFMSNINGRTPILLLAKAAEIFKNIYSDRVYNIKNEEDLEDIKNLNISKIHKPIVVEDISSLYTDEDILKLIEESNLQFILLAYRDNLSGTLMSRCKSILKIPSLEIKSCNYTNKKSALSAIESLRNDSYKSNLYLMENCPELMRDMIEIQQLKYKDRLINIIANMEGGINE